MVLGKSIRRSNGHASSSSSILDGDDTSSASGGGMSIYYQKINQRVAVLEKVAVSVHESRASTREAALASLVGALEGFVPAHFIGWHLRGEIVRGCCASIKKGAAAKEARLALRAVALLAVTLGPGSKRRILPAETASGGGMSIYYQKINQRVAVLEKVAVSVHESRASTREAALASLVGALEGFVPAHFIGWHLRGEIVRGCCASIKKGAAKEARLALRAVALLAVTLGPGSKRRILPAETRQPTRPLVIVALESLAVVAFVDVAAENMDDTEACMKALWGLIRPSTGPKLAGAARKTSPHVLAAAVSAWTLVLTTTDGWKKKKAAASSPAAWRDTAAHLASLLHSDSRAVRMAAGEALAVTIEMKLLTRDSNGALISGVAARASELANEAAGAGVGKANFVEQKELFKSITTFLAGGKAPASSVRASSSHHGRLTASTWTDIVRLNFLRRFLGGGFLPHLQGKVLMGEEAPLIGQVFVVKEDDMAMDHKKKVEKQRTLNRERQIVSDLKHGSSHV
uniref:Interferon-related developmental regulator N-terminal domain-containing protein n=1 Tax=Oryza barthii TaxID=65489 RepID=A0A0D3H1M8_9ORYZ